MARWKCTLLPSLQLLAQHLTSTTRRYADETARAGVLEPEGIVEIKLRKDKILAMMERLDETYRTLKAKSSDASLSAADAATVKADLTTREKTLMPLYQQIALQFADLHECVSLPLLRMQQFADLPPNTTAVRTGCWPRAPSASRSSGPRVASEPSLPHSLLRTPS